jgi:hypothetical protein
MRWPLRDTLRISYKAAHRRHSRKQEKKLLRTAAWLRRGLVPNDGYDTFSSLGSHSQKRMV